MSPPARLALVVHPTRAVGGALRTLRDWGSEHDVPVVQLAAGGGGHEVAEHGEVRPNDLVVALGGDGTVLAALRASAPAAAPVLGVACGSLGALSAVKADGLAAALDRAARGEWAPRVLPALAMRAAGAPDAWAVNDVALVRKGPAQIVVAVEVDGEMYARSAGDGLILATPLGSSGYSMAAGGPVLAASTAAYVCTPLAMHGGSAPPLVVPAGSKVRVAVTPGHGGFQVELDGRRCEPAAEEFGFALEPGRVRLVAFGAPGHGFEALRRRRLIADSPRVLARDERAARTGH